MSSSDKPSWKSPWQWGGCVLPTSVALALLFSPLGRVLELFSFDLLYLFRPTTDPATLNEVVILNMDEESCRSLGQHPGRPWEWDRTVHARLVRELTARQAKVIAFDVLFAEPSADPKTDEPFAAAVRDHGHVVLAASVQQSKDAGRPLSSRLLRPIDALSSNATWGVVEWPDDDPAAIIREQFHYAEYTNFAWQVAVTFGQAPAQRLVKRWLNYYGPAGTLPAVSYHRALDTNAVPRDFFAGKAVFIGSGNLITAQGQTSDRHATPLSRWGGGPNSGVEIHATAFLNLIHNEWLQEVSPWTEILLLIALGVALGIGWPKFAPWTGLALALMAAMFVSAGAVGLAWGFHRWFAWLAVVLVQIPCGLGWAVLAHARRLMEDKAALEKSVALAESLASLPQFMRDAPPSPGSTVPASDVATAKAQPSEAGPPPIPNHRLLRQIGRGAYGEVWLAQDEIGTYHAVKVVYQRSFSSAAPYEREFRGIQKFTPISRNHPGFVHVLHVGRNDPEGYFFYIMELGDDKLTHQQIDPATYIPNTLAALLEGGRLALPRCVQLGLDLTAALEYLHQQQLVHRDIKPANIIFVNRAPKFADIGLVTNIAPEGKAVTFVGTDGYLPPEGPGTVAADIYSLGKVLYEAGTGRDRHEFPSLSGTLVASADQQLTRFNEIILKACEPDKMNRYQTASEMHHDLLRLSQPPRV